MTRGTAQDDPPNLAIAVAVVGLAGVGLGSGIARWVAGAALLAAAPSLVHRLVQHEAWASRRDRLPYALVIVMCVWLLSELILGRPPASRDHALHLFEIHLLVDEFLPSGRVSGWTGSFNNGLPFGEAYPWFSDLWSAVPHLLSFGAISQRASYAFGLLAIWVLAVLGVWLVAAEVAREVAAEDDSPSLAAWAGCLGALIWLLDPGGSRQGGWNYLMFHGVWPQLLSVTLWVVSLPLSWRAFRRPSPRSIAAAALVLGGSVLAHPFGILTLVCSAAIWLAVLAFSSRARAVPPGRYLWWLWLHSIATAIGFGWLASFLAGADALGRSPVPWSPASELAAELVQGTLFAGHAAWTGPLFVLGLLAVIRRGGAVAWLTTGLALGMLVLGSQDAITVLRLDLIASGFKNLQFPRYSIAIKPLVFALAGVGGAVFGGRLWRHLPRARAYTMGQRFIAALVIAPLALALLGEPDRLVARPVGAIESLQASGQAEAEAELRDALQQEKATLGDTELAVAFLRKGMGGGMYPAMSVAAVGGRLLLDGHVATVNFQHGFVRRSAAGLRAMNVTHVIHDKPLDEEDDAALAAVLEPVGTFGVYTLARIVPADSVEPTPRVTSKPNADIEVIESGPLRWLVRVRGVAEPVTVRLPVPPHPKWTAMHGDTPLELTAIKLFGGAMTGSQFVIDADGDITLTYDDSPSERRARWLALVAAVLSLLALALGKPLKVRAWTPSRATRRALLVGTLGATVVLLLFVRTRQQRQLAATWLAFAEDVRLVQPDTGTFVSDAVIDDRVEVTRTPDKVCVGILGKDARDGCTESEHAPRASFMYRAPFVYRCLRFTVPADGTATAELPAPPAGATVVAAVRRISRKGKGKHLTVRTGKRWRPLGNATKDLLLKTGPDGLPPTIEIRNESRRVEPVCLAVGVVEP